MLENYLNVFLMTKMIHCAFFSLGPFWRSSSELTCCSVEVNIINQTPDSFQLRSAHYSPLKLRTVFVSATEHGSSAGD